MKTTLLLSIIIVLSNYMYVNAQDLTITGKVLDSKGALPWASVTLKGNNLYHTKSDEDGRFILNLPSIENDTLVFSYIGYDNQEIPLNNEKNIDVILTESVVQTNDDVVVAFGVIKNRRASIPIPNAYKEDNSIEIPNAYKGDQSVEIPNAALKSKPDNKYYYLRKSKE